MPFSLSLSLSLSPETHGHKHARRKHVQARVSHDLRPCVKIPTSPGLSAQHGELPSNSARNRVHAPKSTAIIGHALWTSMHASPGRPWRQPLVGKTGPIIAYQPQPECAGAQAGSTFSWSNRKCVPSRPQPQRQDSQRAQRLAGRTANHIQSWLTPVQSHQRCIKVNTEGREINF